MTIRPATAQDAAAICAIWNPVIRETGITFNAVEKSTSDIVQMLADKEAHGHGFLVAEEGGTLLGFATYGQFRGGIGYRHTMEHTVILGPHSHGCGIGRGLMTAIEDHARAGRAHSMFAGVSSGNPSSVAFHTTLGYQEIAVLKEVGFKFGRWFDLHLMQKLL